MTANERTAKNLGVGHEIVLLEHGGGKKWRVHNEDCWSSVEVAALKKFTHEGWRGYPHEGGLMLNLIKAAAFPHLPERLRATYTEALFSGNMQPTDHHPLDLLLANILEADVTQIIRGFQVMAAPRSGIGLDNSMLDFFPYLQEWHFTELFDNLGRKRLHEIAELFGVNSYEYRKGWPDLTLWGNGEVVFKEIKAPGDRILASQRKTITNILSPLGYKVSIVDVIPTNSKNP